MDPITFGGIIGTAIGIGATKGGEKINKTASSATRELRKGIKNARNSAGRLGTKADCFGGQHEPPDGHTEGTFECVNCGAKARDFHRNW